MGPEPSALAKGSKRGFGSVRKLPGWKYQAHSVGPGGRGRVPSRTSFGEWWGLGTVLPRRGPIECGAGLLIRPALKFYYGRTLRRRLATLPRLDEENPRVPQAF